MNIFHSLYIAVQKISERSENINKEIQESNVVARSRGGLRLNTEGNNLKIITSQDVINIIIEELKRLEEQNRNNRINRGDKKIIKGSAKKIIFYTLDYKLSQVVFCRDGKVEIFKTNNSVDTKLTIRNADSVYIISPDPLKIASDVLEKITYSKYDVKTEEPIERIIRDEQIHKIQFEDLTPKNQLTNTYLNKLYTFKKEYLRLLPMR